MPANAEVSGERSESAGLPGSAARLLRRKETTVKVMIDAKGVLTVSAESDIEHYALAKWWDDWQQKKAVICIETAADDGRDMVVENDC